jgi:hypothetical protein
MMSAFPAPTLLATAWSSIAVSGSVWTIADSLPLAIVMGLRKGLHLCCGMGRQLTEEEQFKVANAIVEQLKPSNYRIEHGPPLRGHGGNYGFMPADGRTFPRGS